MTDPGQHKPSGSAADAEYSPEVLQRLLASCELILTRPADEAEKMASAMRSAGALVAVAPVIEFVSFIEDNIDHITRILEELYVRGGWLVLPSPTAIRHFIEVLARTALEPSIRNGLRIATIGPAGAEALSLAGLHADFLPPQPRGASLAATLPLSPHIPVLIAGSSQTRPELPSGLEDRGARVQVLPLYAPKPNGGGLKELHNLLSQPAPHNRLRVICITSPSVIDAIADHFAITPGGMPPLFEKCGWVAIGPTTAGRLRDRGIASEIMTEAADPGSDGILQAAALLSARLRGTARLNDHVR